MMRCRLGDVLGVEAGSNGQSGLLGSGEKTWILDLIDEYFALGNDYDVCLSSLWMDT